MNEADSPLTARIPASRPMAFSDGGPLLIPEDAPRTLAEALIRTAAAFPDSGLIYVQPDGKELFQSYPLLLEEAGRILAGLGEMGLRPHDRVILQLEHLKDHFTTFWACILGGIVPVTIAVPEVYHEKSRLLHKLISAWELLERPPFLTTRPHKQSLSSLPTLFSSSGPAVLAIDELKEHAPAAHLHACQPDDLVYLQLTSGSTGIPKCIQETHRAIISHIHGAQQLNGYTPADVCLNWLPVDHVAPIITCHLKDVYLGCREIQVSTPLILADPLKWLDLIDRYRVTHTWSPNFGFKLVSDRLSQAGDRSWDLSCVRYWMNAGEQATLPVIREFLALTAPYGVREQAMQPAFGMAEACTCVTYQNQFTLAAGAHKILNSSPCGPREEADSEATTTDFVDLGPPIPGVQLRIVDQDNHLVTEGVVGRFQIRGSVVTSGYLNNEAANRQAFVGDGWFNSGDLGFILDRRLTLTGREKEMIIIRGVNLYCHEIEDVVQGIDGVEATYVAACSTDDERTGTESLAVFFVSRNPDPDVRLKIIRAIRASLAADLGVTPGYVIPLAREEFPRTTSGKIQRAHLKELLAGGHFRSNMEKGGTAAAGPAPKTERERQLAEVWQALLGVPRVGLHDSFFELGGHSLLAIQLLSRLREHFGVDLSLRSLFEAPTVAELARAMEAAPGGDRVGEVLPLQARLRGEETPLSFAQERLWFSDQMYPGGAAYNLPTALRLSGPLNVAALEQSLTELIRRHEALRTSFPALNGQPRQVVTSAFTFHLPLLDLRSLAPDQREEEGRRRAREEARRPFDLAASTAGSSLLLRASLLRLQLEEHLLLLTVHHIASDGWSQQVLFRELWRLYEAFSRGQPSPLPVLPLQYADYALWQRQWLQGVELERQLAYWKQALAGAAPSLALPTDRPRPPAQTFRGARQPVQIASSVTAALRQLSRQEGATLFMSLLAAFQALLYRCTGQEDITIGSPFANRNRAEIEGLIGFFVNTLPLRASLAGDPSFRELLGRVRETTLGACAHQDLPFEKLVEELHPRRDLSHSPLFQVLFSLEPAPGLAGELAGLSGPHSLRVVPVEVEGEDAKFDLSLLLEEADGRLGGAFEYNTDLFDAATIARMAGHFERVLEGIVADPEQRLSRLPLLTAAERRQVLTEWNPAETAYPRECCLHQWFEAQAARTPAAVAVVCGAERLSYGELNARANQVAHFLRRQGVGPEVRVGLCVERSLEMVGLLGILKAGGAYVPLDPHYPPDRLAFMLQDTRAPVVLSQQSLRARLPARGAAVVCLDTDAPWLSRESSENPAGGATADDLAYVIYTSGSTGRPKGVAVPHRAVMRLVINTNYVQIEATDRVAQVANPSFDAATFEIWGALLNGAQLVLIPREVALSPAALAGAIRQQGITAMFLTTALFNQIAAEAPEAFGSLHHLLIGGEALDARWVRTVLRAGPPRRLLNAYGPTESTTFAAWHRVEQVPEGASSVPIGRPLAQTQLYVLDRHWQPVPIGVAGELFIGGDGLARGYLNQPALTAERFIPHPFSDRPGARLYQTGDQVRRLPDGSLEFLGRLDHQVKLRGFRIELGEIEAVLGQHAAVREAVVLTHEGPSGDPCLVAYLVSRDRELPLSSELRGFLAARLPEYMLPAAFVWLPAFPLTPNGKLDRRALPTPRWNRPEETPFRPPRSPVEELLAGTWTEVLGVEQVGIHDDFFALGGHSLLATRVLARVRHLFQVELPLRSLFEAPTVAGLASRIEAVLNAREPRAVAPLRPASREASLPLSFAQQRLWFLDQLQPANPAYNIPLCFHLTGMLKAVAVEQSLSEILRRHEVLRTCFAQQEGRPVQIITPAQPLSLPVVDLRQLPLEQREEQVRRQSTDAACRGFDLGKPPLWRASLFQVSDDEHVLLLVLHHIVADGWSLEVLCRELSALYAAFAAPGVAALLPPLLPELSMQYADFAVWQRQSLAGERLSAQLDYWKQRLHRVPMLLELPTDRARPAIERFQGAQSTFWLSPPLTSALRALSQAEGVTLFMTLLGAFQTLLGRCTGQDEFLVGSPIAGRLQPELEDLIGFFVNTLALRADLHGDPPFRELLGRVRETTLEAYEHQELPFEKLVETLQPERTLSHSPLLQVVFVLQNTPPASLALPGLSVRPLSVETETAKFDLTLSIGPERDALRGSLEYNTDLFDAATMIRMAGHFETLLAGIVAHPEQRLSRLPLLTEAERQQLLVEWNDREGAGMKGQAAEDSAGPLALRHPLATLPHLFEQQVARTPEAVAVVCGTERLSYRELNTRANQLAHFLRRRGVGPEVRVGLCVERSLEMVVGVLGILKAGGAYVPLDPDYPPDRLAFMLADSETAVLLTGDPRSRGVGERLVESLQHPAPLICLDTDPAIESESTENLVSGVGADHLAYVIYTSGSTGSPKGAMISHGNLTRLFAATQPRFQFDAGDTWALFHSYAFDFSVWEIWGALLYGGRLVVVPYEVSRSPEAFYRLLVSERVTVLNQTPTAFRQLVHAESVLGPMPPALRMVIFGGEALEIQSLKPWFERHGDSSPRLVNMYGITETTVHVTYCPLAAADARPPSESSGRASGNLIGRPLSHLRVYVLDAHLEPVPIGVPGELYVSGAGLARGYLNRPELTAMRFIPDPFSKEPGTRLYRTGDMVRYHADGNLEFLGRLDQQVKVRGFRIEPGEIEAVLRQHPAVREPVVLAREDMSAERCLAAYVTTDGESEVNLNELRRFLQRRLPDYMVPSVFVILEALPRTPNGKIDRRRLPAPDPARPALTEEFVAPRTPIEAALAAIWRDVLGLEQVGVHDSFFELGGHSLRATQVMARVREAFDVALPLRTLFATPTVAGLAVAVVGSLAEQAEGEEIARMLDELERFSVDEAPSPLAAETG